MIVGCLAVKEGFGLNIYDIRTDDLVTALKIFYFGEIGYVTILGLCKTSVLLFYIRSNHPLSLPLVPCTFMEAFSYKPRLFPDISASYHYIIETGANFPGVFPYKRARLTCYVVLASVGICTVVYQFLTILQCIPISYNWEGWKTDLGNPKKCMDLNALGYSSAAANIFQDLVILVIPIPWLIGLTCSFRDKLQIMIMFSVGGL